MKTKTSPLHEIIAKKDAELKEAHASLAEYAKDLRELDDRRKVLAHNALEYETEIKELKDQLKFERGRMCKALEVADNASSAACSIGRTAYRLDELLAQLETTVRADFKERQEDRKRNRFGRED